MAYVFFRIGGHLCSAPKKVQSFPGVTLHFRAKKLKFAQGFTLIGRTPTWHFDENTIFVHIGMNFLSPICHKSAPADKFR